MDNDSRRERVYQWFATGDLGFEYWPPAMRQRRINGLLGFIDTLDLQPEYLERCISCIDCCGD